MMAAAHPQGLPGQHDQYEYRPDGAVTRGYRDWPLQRSCHAPLGTA